MQNPIAPQLCSARVATTLERRHHQQTVLHDIFLDAGIGFAHLIHTQRWIRIDLGEFGRVCQSLWTLSMCVRPTSEGRWHDGRHVQVGALCMTSSPSHSARCAPHLQEPGLQRVVDDDVEPEDLEAPTIEPLRAQQRPAYERASSGGDGDTCCS